MVFRDAVIGTSVEVRRQHTIKSKCSDQRDQRSAGVTLDAGVVILHIKFNALSISTNTFHPTTGTVQPHDLTV